MPLLFSYGTLQDEAVQQSTFGRLLRGDRDELPRFENALVEIRNPQAAAASGRTHHANARHTGRPETFVRGTVFEVTDAELVAADEYERAAGYRRIEVELASGRRAWVYVSGAPDSPG